MRSGRSFWAFIAGVVLTLVVVIVVEPKDSAPAAVVEEEVPEVKPPYDMGKYTELVMLDKPGDIIKVKVLKVEDVFPNGAAMAVSEDLDNYGLDVLFLPEEGVSFYDGMRIEVKRGQRLVQVGVFKYDLNIGNGNVAPVVKIM